MLAQATTEALPGASPFQLWTPFLDGIRVLLGPRKLRRLRRELDRITSTKAARLPRPDGRSGWLASIGLSGLDSAQLEDLVHVLVQLDARLHRVELAADCAIPHRRSRELLDRIIPRIVIDGLPIGRVTKRGDQATTYFGAARDPVVFVAYADDQKLLDHHEPSAHFEFRFTGAEGLALAGFHDDEANVHALLDVDDAWIAAAWKRVGFRIAPDPRVDLALLGEHVPRRWPSWKDEPDETLGARFVMDAVDRFTSIRDGADARAQAVGWALRDLGVTSTWSRPRRGLFVEEHDSHRARARAPRGRWIAPSD